MSKGTFFIYLFTIIAFPFMMIIGFKDYKCLPVVELIFGTSYIMLATINYIINKNKLISILYLILGVIVLCLGIAKLLGVY